MKKRIPALLLCAVLLAMCLPVGALAATPDITITGYEPHNDYCLVSWSINTPYARWSLLIGTEEIKYTGTNGQSARVFYSDIENGSPVKIVVYDTVDNVLAEFAIPAANLTMTGNTYGASAVRGSDGKSLLITLPDIPEASRFSVQVREKGAMFNRFGTSSYPNAYPNPTVMDTADHATLLPDQDYEIIITPYYNVFPDAFPEKTGRDIIVYASTALPKPPAPVPLTPQVNVPAHRLPEYIEAEEVVDNTRPEELPADVPDVEEGTADLTIG